MADNENKIQPEGAQNKGNKQQVNRSRCAGKSHHPHGKRQQANTETMPVEKKDKNGYKAQKNSSDASNRQVPKQPQNKINAAGRQEQKRHELKTDTANGQELKQPESKTNTANGQELKQPERKNEHKHPQQEQSGSLRRRQKQDYLTAEQKAFAEATDIMFEEQERKANMPQSEAEDIAKVEIVGVRFRSTGKIYYFSPLDIKFDADDGVIVETARGQEYGYVALTNRMVDERDTVHPLKPVVRKATPADDAKNKQNKQLEEKAVKVWEELVAKHKLSMSLTDIEYTFDNTKLIFYFTAEGRVDFRELVKDLASIFRTRIELRQIGVRDEAKLLGGLGVCGMPFCCNRFLPDFVQVSIKMAKEQNLSLSSSKISGNCGRLMCCLRYEQEVYDKEYETFPRPSMVVRTAQGTGTIVESNFLNGCIKVLLDGENNNVKTFTRDEVKVIGKSKSFESEPLDKELKALED